MASNKCKPEMTEACQAETDKYLKYNDIMLLGKTGMGKTTTAHKILVANPTKKDYSQTADEDDGRKVVPDDSLQGNQSNTLTYTCSEDLTMWHLSDRPNEIENMAEQLKQLTLSRAVGVPHEQINEMRKTSPTTDTCVLLSNDTSKVRILDVPGFYGPDAAASSDSFSTHAANPKASGASNVYERTAATTRNDLSTMRKILHIKIANKFKFNRVVYFLPETGVPTRDSMILQTELGIMENYFGPGIFDCMVVAATQVQSSYKFFSKEVDLFPKEDQQATLKCFRNALRKVMKMDDVPSPPIIFISLFDSCEEILEKITTANVMREGVNLNFNPYTCARCGIKIGKLEDSPRGKKFTPAALEVCTMDSWSSAISYDETKCHPMLIPKYSKLKRVAGGIAHVITLTIFWGKWPSFGNLEEVCIKCNCPPKAPGCTKIGTDYVHKSFSGTIPVDHTSEVAENYIIINLDPDDEPHEDESDTAAVAGMKQFEASTKLEEEYLIDCTEQGQKGQGDE